MMSWYRKTELGERLRCLGARILVKCSRYSVHTWLGIISLRPFGVLV
jgi:hypothetical protein